MHKCVSLLFSTENKLINIFKTGSNLDLFRIS